LQYSKRLLPQWSSFFNANYRPHQHLHSIKLIYIKVKYFEFALYNILRWYNLVVLIQYILRIPYLCSKLYPVLQIQSFTFSPIQENTYILYNEHKQCAIIDPGCYDDSERERLSAFIQANGLKPELLINTHCHLDHVFGNKYVAEKYGLTLQIHPNEKLVLEFAATAGLMYNLPFDSYTGELVYLAENDVVKLGDDALQVLFTPGHSPGSISFYSAAQHFIISGDVLFSNSIGRTDLPGGDTATLIKSIKEKLLTLPDQVTVYSGHGPATTIGREKRGNPYLS
jgi:hydroxyacylglutathione hydrolase